MLSKARGFALEISILLPHSRINVGVDQYLAPLQVLCETLCSVMGWLI